MFINLRRIIYHYCLIISLFSIPLSAQSFEVSAYNLKDGMPSQEIYDVIQDSTGLLWFASAGGIITYDGSSWEKYDTGNKLKDIHYIQILLSESGDIYALPDVKKYPVLKISGKTFEQIFVEIPNDYDKYSFSRMAILEKNGEIVLATGSHYGMEVFKKGKWKRLTFHEGLKGNFVNYLSSDENYIYASTLNGVSLVDFDLNISDLKNTDIIPPGKILFVKAENRGMEKRLWIVGGKWLGFIRNDRFIMVNSHIEFPEVKGFNRYFLYDDNDRIFLGNQYVIYFIDRKINSIEILNSRNGLISDGATGAFPDYEGNIWITSMRGVNKIVKTPFLNYYRENGLLEDEVTAIELFKTGEMAMGHNRGISLFTSEGPRRIEFPEKKYLLRTPSRVFDLHPSSADFLWYVSAERGVGKVFVSGKFEWVEHSGELYYTSIFEDSRGDVWVGANKGLFKLKSGKLQFYSKLDAWGVYYVRKIFELSDGAIVCPTISHGIIMIEENNVNFIHSEELTQPDVYSVCEISPDTILAGTGKGLYYTDREYMRKYPLGDYFFSYPVYFIEKGPDGSLWFGTSNGVSRWDGKKLKSYSESNGMSGNETNRDASKMMPNGRLWIGTDKGMSCYIPEFDTVSSVKPKLELNYLEDNEGKKYSLGEEILLGSNQNSFNITYTGYSFIDEENLLYRIYILNNMETVTDSFTTTQNFARISNLQPDSYRFGIKMKNARGTWSDIVYSGNITIKLPVYERWWFYLISALIATVFFYIVITNITGRKHSRELEIKVKERTSELKKSEEKYRKLIQTANDAIVSTDLDFKILTWNYSAEKIFKWRGTEPEKKDLLKFTAIQIMNSGKEFLQKRLAEKGNWNGEAMFSDNGEKRNLLVSVSVITDRDNSAAGYLMIFRDISERKQYEELKSRAVFESIEKERRRISRELHDDLGQILGSAKFKLEAFGYKFGKEDENLDNALEMLKKAGKELRNVIHDLHPPELERYGLATSVEDLAGCLRERGIKVEFSNEGCRADLESRTEMMIYRIIQEIINNILKHSEASIVKILLSAGENSFISISDNGKGFDPEEIQKRKNYSYGLINMVQRAEIIGGHLQINSSPGNGTEITLRIENKG